MKYSFGTVALGAAGLLTLVTSSFAPIVASAQVAPVKVTISTFVDGSMATASSTNSVTFPMTATWSNTGSASGSGSFNMGPFGFNSDTPYQAVTADMGSGANYGVSETLGGTTVAASCSGSQPFQLVGYSVGNSLAAAQSASISTTAPNLTNITNDTYVIVWNRHCNQTLATPSPISPANGASITTSNLSTIDWTDVTSPFGGITYTYQSSNSSATNSDGTFTNPVYTSGALTASQIGAAGTPTGTYYWHVQAKDANGNTSPWSQAANFTVTTDTATQTPATSTVKVHVLGYLDGQMANSGSANSFQFPMASTWTAANLNGGATASGSYVLGTNFGGAANQYGADTAAMQVGANYQTNEVTGSQVLPIGAACTNGAYQLAGYTTSSTSFADAASKTPTSAVPSFSNLQNDQYVIVWNKTCGTQQNPQRNTGTGTLVVRTFNVIGGANATLNFSGNKGIGNFSIATNNGFGSQTFSNLRAGTYSINENQQQGWNVLINTCKNVRVKNGQTAQCYVINRGPINWGWNNHQNNQSNQNQNNNYGNNRSTNWYR